MSNKKNRWLVILLCINVVLITALVLTQVSLPRAYGQVRPYDYLLVSGKIRRDTEVVWVVDLAGQQLTSCIYDENTRRIEYGNVVDISFLPEFMQY